jgi:Asp-tRNA(Asn)/Glu-tRNA(Gln) amidotransferase B subunit
MISYSHAKMVLFEIIDGDSRSASEIAKEKGFLKDKAINLSKVKEVIDSVLQEKSEIVEKVKEQAKSDPKKKGGPIMFLVGECMKRLKAQGDPSYVQEYIRVKIFGEK